MFVEYADIVSLNNKSSIEDFKDAINSYFKEYVQTESPGKGKKKNPEEVKKDQQPKVQFFLVIIPGGMRQEFFYTALKNKINSDNPLISQFVNARTIEQDKERIFINIIR